MAWTTEHVPDLHGTVILVTGATSGLGFEATRALAAHGAHIVLGTRNAAKTERVMEDVRRDLPAASLEHLPLDLADLASVPSAVQTFTERHDRLDRLINNAGVMATPSRRTAQGHELQFGTNHLGHFALTAGLLPVLRRTGGARVVSVSSGVHRMGRIDPETGRPHVGRRYNRWRAYGGSKLANLLFTLELQRRLEENGDDVIAVAAHPGYAATGLQSAGPAMEKGPLAALRGLVMQAINRVVAQDAAGGALPILYAATAPGVPPNSYWGPAGPGELRGGVAPADRSAHARDRRAARALWQRSEELTDTALHAA